MPTNSEVSQMPKTTGRAEEKRPLQGIVGSWSIDDGVGFVGRVIGHDCFLDFRVFMQMVVSQRDEGDNGIEAKRGRIEDHESAHLEEGSYQNGDVDSKRHRRFLASASHGLEYHDENRNPDDDIE